ncbi:hypothetical protein Hanom_Chr14g01292791 [Helianthus anomalus]
MRFLISRHLLKLEYKAKHPTRMTPLMKSLSPTSQSFHYNLNGKLVPYSGYKTLVSVESIKLNQV